MKKSVNVSAKRGKNDTNESLINRFLRKMKKEGVVKEVLKRRYHKKPSVKAKEKRENSLRRKKTEARKKEGRYKYKNMGSNKTKVIQGKSEENLVSRGVLELVKNIEID